MGLLNRYRYQLVLFEKPAMTAQDLESALDIIGGQVDEPAMRRLLSGSGPSGMVTVAQSNSKSGISTIQSHLRRAKCDAVLVDAGISPRAALLDFLDGIRQPAISHDSAEAELNSGQAQKATLVLGLVVFGLVGFLTLGQLFSSDQAPARSGELAKYVTGLEQLTPEERESRLNSQSHVNRANSEVNAVAGDPNSTQPRVRPSESSDDLFEWLELLARCLPLAALLFGLVMGALLQRQALFQLRGERKPSLSQWAIISLLPLFCVGLCVAILAAPSRTTWQLSVLSLLCSTAGSAVFLTFFSLTAKPVPVRRVARNERADD